MPTSTLASCLECTEPRRGDQFSRRDLHAGASELEQVLTYGPVQPCQRGNRFYAKHGAGELGRRDSESCCEWRDDTLGSS